MPLYSVYRNITAFLTVICMVSVLRADSTYSITVHFQYGSKPAKGHKQDEQKRFGGIHGGHVVIAYKDSVCGFVPSGAFHILPHKRCRHSRFTCQSLANWAEDTTGEQYLSVTIMVDSVHYTTLLQRQRQYLKQTPYDYAFLGMRCAAATYDLLSNGADILRKKTRAGTIYRCFYPRLLRKQLINLAAKTHFAVFRHGGTTARHWEQD